MYTYYTVPLHDLTVAEIAELQTERYTITVPVYEGGDANNDLKKEVEVEIVSPVGYTLTDMDHARIDELLYDER